MLSLGQSPGLPSPSVWRGAADPWLLVARLYYGFLYPLIHCLLMLWGKAVAWLPCPVFCREL